MPGSGNLSPHRTGGVLYAWALAPLSGGLLPRACQPRTVGSEIAATYSGQPPSREGPGADSWQTALFAGTGHPSVVCVCAVCAASKGSTSRTSRERGPHSQMPRCPNARPSAARRRISGTRATAAAYKRAIPLVESADPFTQCGHICLALNQVGAAVGSYV